jgi:hypothetical protein
VDTDANIGRFVGFDEISDFDCFHSNVARFPAPRTLRLPAATTGLWLVEGSGMFVEGCRVLIKPIAPPIPTRSHQTA